MERIKLITTLVERIRREGSTGIPVDVRLLVKLAALSIVESTDGLPSKARACYDESRGRIQVRPGLALDQERFAIAHELGHYYLEHGSRACYDQGLVGENSPMDEADVGIDFEAEASRFAGALLIPRAENRSDVEKGMSFPEMATKYCVSLTATAIAVQQHNHRIPKRRR